jgi:hypothetical protein
MLVDWYKISVERHGVFNVSCGHLNKTPWASAFRVYRYWNVILRVSIPQFFLALFFSMFFGAESSEDMVD